MSVTHGYYTVGARSFINKLEAIRYADQTNQWPRWYWHDHAFDQHHWDQEPPASLPDLYLRRAQQLRSRYDWLVLQFSGGHDSMNILETFAHNDLVIDQIMIRGAFDSYRRDPLDRSASQDNAVMDFSAYPNACWYRDSCYRDCVISVRDFRPHVIDRMSKPDWHDHVMDANINGAANWRDYDMYDDVIRDHIEAGRTVGIMVGIDKPCIYQDQGQWWIRFMDKIPLQNLSPRCYQDQGLNIEFFYWQPDLPELIIKQAHVIKRAAKQGHHARPWWNSTDRSSQDIKAMLLYRPTRPIWDTAKDSGRLIREFDSWFYANPNDAHVRNWHRTLTNLDATIPDHWKDDERSIFSGIKGIFSQARCLGT